MKVFAVLCAVCLATALGGEAEDYEAEGAGSPAKQAPSYTPAKYQPQQYVIPSKAAAYSPPQQLAYLAQPAYKFVSQSSQAPVSYVPSQPQPQQHQQQQQPQYGFVSQNAYSAPNYAKISAAPQKLNFAPIHPQAPTPVPYSLATDVSSFKYSSPLVSYSNLGLLSQANGKASASQPQQQPSQQQAAAQPLTYTSPQQFVYRPKAQPQPQPINYAAPQASPKYIYSQAPQPSYTPQQPQSQPIYSPAPQKLSASVPQFLYRPAAQPSYTPAQQPQQAYSTQPVQPAHSVPHAVFAAAPQYQTQDVVYGHQNA